MSLVNYEPSHLDRRYHAEENRHPRYQRTQFQPQVGGRQHPQGSVFCDVGHMNDLSQLKRNSQTYNEFIMTAKPRRLTTTSTMAWLKCALINGSELFGLSAWLANSSLSARTGRKTSKNFPRSRFDSVAGMLGILGRGAGFTEARSCVAKADPRKRA